MLRRIVILSCCLPLVFTAAHSRADDFERLLKPLFSQRCSACHGNEEHNAEVSFDEIRSATDLLHNPGLIHRILEAVDSNAMPPESEPELDEENRSLVVNSLKSMLKEATAGRTREGTPIRRLNRFQYNNTVRDLFRLNRNVSPLPEKLMTRYDNYLNNQSGAGAVSKMPDTVQVASQSLNPEAGLRDVQPYPKDLRAEHGFDNQANQLTLSPLLLDAFLRLSVSIVESPDFNEQTVGIWSDFFTEPAEGTDHSLEVRRRLQSFLRRAFRGPVDDDTLNRYTAYTMAKMEQGLSFTDSMKKTASAALSSPMFLYRSASADDHDQQFELASKLSYFLWGSCPDEELLALAERGELSRPEILNNTIDRMMADPKIERFLDSYPSQWMQLENLLAATPDPQINKYFSLDKDAPASLQMVLEPLLLFDAVFIENRPIVELIAPPFGYQSDFLKTWYTSDLKPPVVDTEKIIAENQRNTEQRRRIEAAIRTAQTELDDLIEPVRNRLLEARRSNPETAPPVDLRPYAAWEFNEDLKETVRGLDLTAHGDIQFRDGMVVLERAYLLSKPLPVDLKARSLEIWCRPHNPDERGGGLMGIQGPGDFFDTIVIGERKNRHWISGSNGFSRTEDFPESVEETETNETLHLVMVYAEDGTTALYRNGQPYGKPFNKGAATFPREQSSVIFGLRHLPAGGNKFLSVSIDQAKLYDRALTAEEVAAAASGHNTFISEKELTAALTDTQRAKKDELTKDLESARTSLKQVPENKDPGKIVLETEQKFEADLIGKMRSRIFSRVPVSDPRYGGVITNAAMLSMTSGPKRTHPVARGVWIIEVIFNDPPAPPPNDVPPLDEETGAKDLTIREQFAAHRENPSCAGCHTKLDPLGFALENFDITGRWRDTYENGRSVDSSGTLWRKHDFDSVVRFRESLVRENRRFAKAFTEHLLRFALARELNPADAVAVYAIVDNAEKDDFRLKSLIRAVVLSDSFLQAN